VNKEHHTVPDAATDRDTGLDDVVWARVSYPILRRGCAHLRLAVFPRRPPAAGGRCRHCKL